MRRPDRTTIALAGVLLGALLLRLWGIRSGLPFSYNSDEDGHFVPVAVGFFGHGLNPRYFLNPPGYTELLYLLYAVRYGGRAAVDRAYASDPSEVFLLARVTVALLGTTAVWLLHLAGARLLDRSVGLLAAAIGAVAFLPVFYGHLALNDVPAMAAATLALLGAALVLRGRPLRGALLGGLAAGLAAGTKYTAGIALLPLLTAIVVQARAERTPSLRAAVVPLGAACAAALAGFLVANPYALLDLRGFRAGVVQQRTLTSGENLPKLGLTQSSGIVYYLWSLTWGLGWIPALAALGGALRLLVAVRYRSLALVLLPAPVLYLLAMGLQERYFGRWLLPVLPIAILLAAYAGIEAARAAGRRAPRLALPAAALVAVALLAQGLVHSLHDDRVLARPDTRGSARAWLVAHVPAGARVVVEPFAPASWLQDPDRAAPATPGGERWRLWDVARADVDQLGRPLARGRTRYVRVDEYERTLRPALLDRYVAGGFCWVVTSSDQSARAFAQPRVAPRALAYYAALARRGAQVARFSPFRAAATPPRFDFDHAFDYYPLAYARPGPTVSVYRLHGGRCGPAAPYPH
ncbi:MAG TPA: glycosyltransferase family 39 protein [Conexibacter sp.]|nr:glycosyltransferase family 39 protein [Conexibacter sp.]